MSKNKIPIVIGLYGYSSSGKTTLIERLIRELKIKGLRVSAVKQSGHPVSLDTEGKDTQRFARAGADPVVLTSTIETNVRFNRPLKIKEIIELIATIDAPDIVIIESARDEEIKKIRIGDIDLRKNTIWTYDGNFDNLIEKVMKGE